MVLRNTPPGEDPTLGVRAQPVPFQANARPPGENADLSMRTLGKDADDGSELEMQDAARKAGTHDDGGETQPPATDFLQLVREAEQQALLYQNQTNRRAWSQSYRAWHNEHFSGSKYLKPDWRNRSKIFIPKTRSAVRKDSAAVMASLFNNVKAINCMPGNESDPRQRASAALIEQIVNYRTDRASGRAALPWFTIANGARQDALMTGVCLSKQTWKLELRKTTVAEPVLGPDGQPEVDDYGQPTGRTQQKQKWIPEVDRPDMDLIPPENYVIDPAADWTNPCQTASYIIIRWPMRLDEIRRRMASPVGRWNYIDEEKLKSYSNPAKMDQEAIRRARESGVDRMDEAQTGYEFQVIWVSEVYMKTDHDDWTFFSIGDQVFLTQPRKVRDVYPEQFGERPLSLGYGNLESHRIFPMSAVESWQQLQLEINDVRNLALDATKQNVMPITKIKRGRQIDMDQVKKRSSGSAIIVSDKDDVTWEQPPQLSQQTSIVNRELELEFDDLAGQFNSGTTENNNALSRTLGGLKLVAGSANAVQEYDIRVWIHTWAEPAIMQIARLIQYYESDEVILGVCGERAQILQKFGVDKITDDLLEEEVLVRVSIGVGAGDPMQRLQKFQMAVSIAGPLLAQTKEFQNGSMRLDPEAIMEEVFGGAGYNDGGRRFVRKGPPDPQNPMMDLQIKKLQAEIDKLDKTGKSSVMTGLAALAKVDLGDRQLEADNANAQMDQQRWQTERVMEAHDMGNRHAHDLHDRLLAARDHGHRHGIEIAQHKQGIADGAMERASQIESAAAQPAGGAKPKPAGGQQTPQQPDPAVAALGKKMDGVIELLRTLITQMPHGSGPGFPPNPYPQAERR